MPEIRSLFLLSALLLPACVASPPAPPPVPPPEAVPREPAAPVEATPRQEPSDLFTAPGRPLDLDPAIHFGQLENGLSYYVRENHRPEERVEIWLVVDAGSVQEDEDQRGLAHFVEHMAFNGTCDFRKQELVEYLESIGIRFGPDVNASTGFDETVYTLTVPTDEEEIVDRALLILENWARCVTFAPEEVEKERGVVMEEWRLGRGAAARLREKQLPVLFHGSRYAERLPIGEREILETAPPAALERFYEDWYRPDLMAVIVVGDVEAEEIVAEIRARFRELEPPAEPRTRTLHPLPAHERTLVEVATDPEATQTTAGIHYKHPPPSLGSAADYRRSLVERLYITVFNDRLVELAQRAEPPFLFAGSDWGLLVRSAGVYSQVVAVAEGGLQKGLAALLREAERMDRFGVTATELERARTNLLRSLERAYAERDKIPSASLAAEYQRHFLEGEAAPGIARELELARHYLPTISLEEVNALARRWISEDNRVVLVSAPEASRPLLPTEEDLLALFRAAERETLEAWQDRVREAPLMPRPPDPGAVVTESSLAAVGVTRWRLSNGAEVLLKPTDFRNDQVLLTGFSPGGTSVVPDGAHASALLAATVVQEGGLGEFSQSELEKALSGVVASASTYLSELEEGVTASASPRDLETMFQLVHLRLTAPRRDREAFDSVISRLGSLLERRAADPQTVFQDRLQEVLYQGHPRRRPLSREMLQEVSLDQAFAIYEERFADAGDFTFVVVGNFQPESIRPLVERYLASLPATGREESWRDRGITTPDEVVELQVRKGLEPKSQVRLVFTGPADPSRAASHQMSTLTGVLRGRLREVLREDMGGTYGVSVSGSVSSRPRPSYELSIAFGTAPESVEALLDALFQELEAFRRGEVDPVYLERVKAQQRRERETDLRENPFWVTRLKSYTQEGWPLEQILELEALIQEQSMETVSAAARRYLDPERYVQAVLHPADPAP